jgi:hypothetical protein
MAVIRLAGKFFKRTMRIFKNVNSPIDKPARDSVYDSNRHFNANLSQRLALWSTRNLYTFIIDLSFCHLWFSRTVNMQTQCRSFGKNLTLPAYRTLKISLHQDVTTYICTCTYQSVWPDRHSTYWNFASKATSSGWLAYYYTHPLYV